MGGLPTRRARTGVERERNRVRALRRALLRWGETRGRRFFWRNEGMSPFAILVVEILLTKTRAEIVAPVAPLLLSRFPTPSALAGAKRQSLERILYPLDLHRKRARQLIACADALVREHAGEVPTVPT